MAGIKQGTSVVALAKTFRTLCEMGLDKEKALREITHAYALSRGEIKLLLDLAKD